MVETAAHTYGDWTQDETEHAKTCTVCEYSVTGSHDYTNVKWNDDGDTHYRTCTICKAVEHAEHSFGGWKYILRGEHRGVCSDCSKTERESCQYEEEYHSTASGDGHYRNCVKCGTKEADEPHTFGANIEQDPEAPDTHHFNSCTKCGYRERFRHTLVYESISETTHRISCQYCDYVVEGEHQLSELLFDSGEQHCRLCAVCKFKTDYSNHNFSAWTPGIENHYRICQGCKRGKLRITF